MALSTLIHRPRARRPAVLHFDRLLDELWGGFGLAPLAFAERGSFPARCRSSATHGVAGRFSPQLGARELETEYRVTVEVPGVDAKDLEVTVDGGVLHIQGLRRYADAEKEKQAKDEKEPEAPMSFERRLRFPGEIAEGEVTASYKNGVLTVTVPKLIKAEPEVRTISVETA